MDHPFIVLGGGSYPRFSDALRFIRLPPAGLPLRRAPAWSGWRPQSVADTLKHRPSRQARPLSPLESSVNRVLSPLLETQSQRNLPSLWNPRCVLKGVPTNEKWFVGIHFKTAKRRKFPGLHLMKLQSSENILCPYIAELHQRFVF